MSDRYRQFLDDIRARVSITDLVQKDGAKLIKRGRAFVCLSPMRKETAPSFYLYPDQNSWHDFGPGVGGDVFEYVMKRDNCDFKTASAKLGQFANIDLYWENGDFKDGDEFKLEIARKVDSQVTFCMLTEAAIWFHEGIFQNDKILAMLHEQWGLTDETIDKYKIGWSTLGLYHYFRDEMHYSEEACLKTGLFIKTSHGIEEFFNNRIVFPYWSGGLVQYMIGRQTIHTPDVEWEKGKYKKLLIQSDNRKYVSPWILNDVLYNEDVLRKVHGGELIVTEGVTDCIAFDQYGFPCVSPVATSFSDKELQRVARAIEHLKGKVKLIICNDNEPNKSGEKGALRTAAYFFALGHDVWIAELPTPSDGGKVDACDFLKTHGADGMRKVLTEARRYLEFMIDSIPVDLEPIELEIRLKPVIEAVASCPPMQREAYGKRVSKRFGVSRDSVRQTVAKTRPAAEPEPEKPKKKKQVSTGKVRGEVSEEIHLDGDQIGSYYVVKSESGFETISSFSLKPALRIVVQTNMLDVPQMEVFRCDIITNKGRVIKNCTFPMRAWRSKRDFIDHLKSVDLQWTGNDDHVQGVLRILSSSDHVPTQIGTTIFGYFDGPSGPRWVWSGGVLASDGQMEQPDVIALPSGTSMDDRLNFTIFDELRQREMAKKIIPDLLSINKPEVVIPCVAWFFASVFKPRIMRKLSHFPILLIWGNFGSGKSSIISSIMWPMFGVFRDAEPSSCTEKYFPTLLKLSSTTSIPVFLDEYKPKDMRPDQIEQVHRYMRRCYGGEIEEKGQADQTLKKYKLSAPLIVAGEAPPGDGDDAISERVIVVHPEKSSISLNGSSSDESRLRISAFNRLRSMPLYYHAGIYAKWSLSVDVDRMLDEAEELVAKLMRQLGAKAETRVMHNLIVMMFGVLCFDLWCKELSIETRPVDLAQVLSSQLKWIQRGGEDGHVRDMFDAFFEELSTYCHEGALVEGTHYAKVNGHLCMHLPSCYRVYLSERSRRRQSDETNGLRALERAVHEKVKLGSYVLESGKRVRMSGLPGNEALHPLVRCVVIDEDRIPGSMDYIRFKCTEERKHGGDRTRPN